MQGRTFAVGALLLLAAPQTVSAQYRPQTNGPAIAEDYHIEAAYNWWNAEPTDFASSRFW